MVPAITYTIMPKKISDIALAKVPSLANRVSLYQSKLQITRHAPSTITDYSHTLYKAVSHIGKLPEEFTQKDADSYMARMLSRQPQPVLRQGLGRLQLAAGEGCRTGDGEHRALSFLFLSIK